MLFLLFLKMKISDAHMHTTITTPLDLLDWSHLLILLP